jgi:multicomponent Na+:H+ antiporter subunit D
VLSFVFIMQFYKSLLLSLLAALAIILLYNNFSTQNLSLSFSIIFVPFLLCAALVVLSAYKIAFSEMLFFGFYTISSLGAILFQQIELIIISIELMSLSASFIIAAGCKNYEPAIRYACTHFFIGVLLITSIAIGNKNLSTLIMIFSLLMNCACFPFSFWVTDAYPAASLHGTSYLSLFTTKISFLVMILHTYQLWSCYSEVLAVLGSITTIYGIMFASFEKNIRRFLCYGIIAQMGVLILIGSLLTHSENAVPLLTFYIVVSLFYQILLFFVANSIILKTKAVSFNRATTFVSIEGVGTTIAVLTMAAFPGTIGFLIKSYITTEIDTSISGEYLFKTLNLLLYAGIGLKFIYYTFTFKFNKRPMIINKDSIFIIILSLICINPYLVNLYLSKLLLLYLPKSLSISIYSQFSLLFCTTLLFIPLRKLFLPRISLQMDIDWIFRALIPYIVSKITIRKKVLQNLTFSPCFNSIAKYETVSVPSASIVLVTVLLILLCLNH